MSSLRVPMIIALAGTASIAFEALAQSSIHTHPYPQHTGTPTETRPSGEETSAPLSPLEQFQLRQRAQREAANARAAAALQRQLSQQGQRQRAWQNQTTAANQRLSDITAQTNRSISDAMAGFRAGMATGSQSQGLHPYTPRTRDGLYEEPIHPRDWNSGEAYVTDREAQEIQDELNRRANRDAVLRARAADAEHQRLMAAAEAARAAAERAAAEREAIERAERERAEREEAARRAQAEFMEAGARDAQDFKSLLGVTDPTIPDESVAPRSDLVALAGGGGEDQSTSGSGKGRGSDDSLVALAGGASESPSASDAGGETSVSSLAELAAGRPAASSDRETSPASDAGRQTNSSDVPRSPLLELASGGVGVASDGKVSAGGFSASHRKTESGSETTAGTDRAELASKQNGNTSELSGSALLGRKIETFVLDFWAGLNVEGKAKADRYEGNPEIMDGSLKGFDFSISATPEAGIRAKLGGTSAGATVAGPTLKVLEKRWQPARNIYMGGRIQQAEEPLREMEQQEAPKAGGSK